MLVFVCRFGCDYELKTIPHVFVLQSFAVGYFELFFVSLRVRNNAVQLYFLRTCNKWQQERDQQRFSPRYINFENSPKKIRALIG